jgi:hypothetical protein
VSEMPDISWSCNSAGLQTSEIRSSMVTANNTYELW